MELEEEEPSFLYILGDCSLVGSSNGGRLSASLKIKPQSFALLSYLQTLTCKYFLTLTQSTCVIHGPIGTKFYKNNSIYRHKTKR
jgi:hypothetical protein